MKQNRKQTNLNRRAALSALAASALGTTGCPLSIPESLPGQQAGSSETSLLSTGVSAGVSAGSIAELVDQTLQIELRTRTLSTMLNGAWQIFHGILAYGEAFEIDTLSGRRPALSYFSSGGTCSGFHPMPGNPIGPDQRLGLRVEIQPSTKVGQGHRDQWLAVVAQAGLPMDAPWIVGDETFLVGDWMRQAEFDVPLNYESEFSWTLIPLSFYRPTDYRWTARDGETYSTELLLESEVMRDLEASVCGGTHRLIGIAFAVKNRISEGKPMTGVWAAAKSHLDAAIELAKTNQNPDGSYSTSYMHRTGWCNDLGEGLGTTGHVLEYLTLAADPKTLQSDWVQRSVRELCGALQRCRGIDLECGVLYHALHALVEYKRRIA